MTYVMGINHLGVNAIICDTRVTWWRSTTPQRTGENVVLKSGLFFPGCIYAISGSMGHANKFIIECKEYLTGENTLMGFWEKCRRFVECYRFPKGENRAFSLLLSSRYSGEPWFFILDSAQGELKQADRAYGHIYKMDSDAWIRGIRLAGQDWFRVSHRQLDKVLHTDIETDLSN